MGGDILETRAESGTTFKAISDRAKKWMQDIIGSEEYTFRLALSAMSFRNNARNAGFSIKRVDGKGSVPPTVPPVSSR